MESLTNKLLSFIAILSLFNSVCSLNKDEDYYTSLIGIQKLAKTEQIILKSMVDLLEKMEHRKSLILKYIEDYEQSVKPVLNEFPFKEKIRKFTSKFHVYKEMEDLEIVSEAISAHPLLAYRMLRRFAHELPIIMMDFSVEIETDFVKLLTTFPERMRVPNKEDMDGSADGLLRIQDYYNFDVSEFLQGKFKEIETHTGLNAFDINYIGIRATGNPFRAVEWLERSYNKVSKEEDSSISEDIVRLHLENAIVKYNAYLETANKDSKLNESFLFKSLPKLSTNVTLLDLTGTKNLLNNNWKSMNHRINYDFDSPNDGINFRALCSGGKELREFKVTKALKCYVKKDTPYTLIAPLKLEIYSRNPPIIQIYDLISDSKIARIKKLASPQLIRAKIVGTPDNPDVKSDLRTSTVTWIRESFDDLLKDIPRIIYEATGFNATTGNPAEELQISSYGSIGGHYEPHLDPLFDEKHLHFVSEMDKFRGDRIATVMFYLTDIIKGGGTAFPRLGLITKPSKGSALVWFNLLKNGNKNKLMLHGACPVVFGNKWVANKWIRRNAQMFKKPCGKNYQDNWNVADLITFFY